MEINIPPLSTGYMDLKNSGMKTKLRTIDHINLQVTEGDSVGLTNLPLHTIFAQVYTSLQQTPVSQLGSIPKSLP